MATYPPSWNLRLWADRMRPSRKCFCAIMGDSTCATNQGGGAGGQARWAYGIIRRWPVAWAQYVAWDFSTAGLEGSSSIYLPGTGVNAGALLSDGVTANPFCLAMVENSVTSAGLHTNNFGRVLIQLTTAQYRGGDWTAGNPIRITRLNTFPTNNWAVGCHQMIANGGPSQSTLVDSAAIWGSSTGAMNAWSHDWVRNSTPATDITLNLLNHTAGGPATGNCYKTICRVMNTTTGLGINRGFGWASISQGGWNSRNHIDGYSTAALAWEIAQYDLDVLIIQLGINVAPGEASGGLPTATYAANYRELLTKVHAAFALAGKTDYTVVCQTPWQAGPASQYQTAQSEMVAGIAREYDRTCYVSMDSLIRLARGEGWYDAGPGGQPLLAASDGVHQSTAGAMEMADLVYAELMSKQSGLRGRASIVRPALRTAA